MAEQMLTRAAETDQAPQLILAVLTNATLLPQWAPLFADFITHNQANKWTVTKTGATFILEVIAHPESGTVDYLREMEGIAPTGAYLRVIPRPMNGSVITMTVPLGPGADQNAVAKDVDTELQALIALSRSR